MADKQSIVLIVDEKNTCKGLSAVLGPSGFKTAFLDPTEDFTAPTNQYDFKAVIYEPYFVMGDGRRFRPIVDALISRARCDGARLIALTSLSQSEITEAGFYPGEHYDGYFRKPTNAKEIVEVLRE